MQANRLLSLFILIILIGSCRNESSIDQQKNLKDTADHTEVDADTLKSTERLPPTSVIDTRDVSPESLTSFAKTLIGTPYKYGSIEPKQGFDCSGFITYVFNHFKIAVPRSSKDFTNVGTEISVSEAKP